MKSAHSPLTKQKIALVTGAGIRIGQAIAEYLLESGYKLFLHANNSYNELCHWASKHHKRDLIIACIEADLSNQQGQEKLAAEVLSSTLSLDLVVHNASLFAPRPFATISREEVRVMMAVNLEAPYFLSQALLPLLAKGHDPSIVNIIDAMWDRPSRGYSHYAMSKAGLALLTRSLAKELAPTIRVNGVSPGAILFQPFHDEEVRSQTLARIPLGRLGSVKDIAQAVLFLSQAAYVTGEIINIDGGRSIS
jgi:pteridine reductase